MQVTKKLEYAILSTLYLAKRGYVCEIGEIATAQKISVTFVAKILQYLVKAGILTSRRGPSGGFSLARASHEISLFDIAQAVDESVIIGDCLENGASCVATNCALQPVWSDIQQFISAKLSETSLADLVAGAAENSEPAPQDESADKNGSRGTRGAVPRNIIIFCDFDGTISTKDVSDSIFTKWLGTRWADIDREYHNGSMSMVELYRRCWALVDASEGEILEFVDAVGIDPHFAEFVQASRQAGIPVYLVSDGFDYYIERIMDRHGLSHLAHHSNHLRFDNGVMVIEFNNQHPECDRCANCKKSVIDAKREGADFVIYIGDGNSDRCAAEHADLVFAKHRLREHCDEQGIPYIPYQNFNEVMDYLKQQGLL
ncbi:MAG TPA: MtnX-like HAD-IB family phosphatase [Candidatus Aquicultor sp.]|jgi:2,3-diketo-5-methylthio-1-phosphopentane phosphatase